MDAADHSLLRDHLIMINVYINHWRADVECNRPPTRLSLDTAQGRVRRSIELLDRVEGERVRHFVIEHEEAS